MVWKSLKMLSGWARAPKVQPVPHHRPHDILGIAVLPNPCLQFQKYPFFFSYLIMVVANEQVFFL